MITDLTKTCLRLWRGTYGERFGLYDNDSKPRSFNRPDKKTHTFTQLKRDVFAAAQARTALSSRSVPLAPYVQGPAPAGTVVDTDSFQTLGHTRFMKTTAEKRRQAKHAMQKRSLGEDPFPVHKKRLSGPVMPSMTMGGRYQGRLCRCPSA